MDLNRQGQQRRQRSRDYLDRRVDKWIETGRQFVDGVAGNRPGKRKVGNGVRAAGSSMETVGRWVGDKLDWFLEDEDSWLEPWQSDSKMTSTSGKRPLDAISRRVAHENEYISQESLPEDQWPEESSFRINRWQRNSIDTKADSGNTGSEVKQTIRSERRPLPRSSRRRDL